jgi:hypothetical protein
MAQPANQPTDRTLQIFGGENTRRRVLTLTSKTYLNTFFRRRVNYHFLSALSALGTTSISWR